MKEVREPLLETGVGAGLTGSPGEAPGARQGRGQPGRHGRGRVVERGLGSQLCSRVTFAAGKAPGEERTCVARGGGRIVAGVGGVPSCALGGRHCGWECPFRALLGPHGLASSERTGGVRTTGKGTGTA